MVIGDLGLLTPMETIQLASSAAATAAAAQKKIDEGPLVSVAKLNVIGFGRAQASGSNVPAALQNTSVANPNATSATAGAAGGSSKTIMIAAAAGIGLIALLAIAKKKKR